jgi:hypothetical protein
MNMDFATRCPLVRRSRLISGSCPSTRTFAPRFLQTPPRGDSRRARRALVEAAWTYRYPARVSETLRARLEGLPKPVRDIAWKAQVRLCARYRRLSATGKKP